MGLHRDLAYVELIGDLGVPWGMIPPWLRTVAVVFPVRHLAAAVVGPISGSGGVAWSDLGVVALWGRGRGPVRRPPVPLGAGDRRPLAGRRLIHWMSDPARWEPRPVASNLWGPEVAEAYDASSADMFDPAVLGPTVDVLADLAEGGPALELAVGTGRVALALAARGVEVAGIELSPHMAGQLMAKPGAEAVALTMGDMATARAPGTFSLVYLVFNTIMNVTTQEEQVAVFVNAADHLGPGGRFVVEVVVPRPPPPGQTATVFTMDDDHVGVDTLDDPIGQISSSHHWIAVGGRLVRHSAPYRYVWPSELVLMGRLAGMNLEHRWAGWDRKSFTAESTSHIAVFRTAP